MDKCTHNLCKKQIAWLPGWLLPDFYLFRLLQNYLYGVGKGVFDTYICYSVAVICFSSGIFTNFAD